MTIAKKRGYDEVIYLDAVDGNRIEELGSANIFICKNGVVKTPKLGRSILAGITRDSVCKIVTDIMEMELLETDIYIKDLLEADEVFCTGTAVVVAPVGKINFEGKSVSYCSSGIGPITAKCKNIITAIQKQEINDPFNWLHNIEQ